MQFVTLGVGAERMGRQELSLERTAPKKRPAKRSWRLRNAR
jgi:hypothetical protein